MQMIVTHPQDSATSALSILEDFANRRSSGVLKFSANGVNWFVYLSDGMIFHANFSINPFERLELYLQKLLNAQQRQINQNLFEKLRERITGAKLEDFYPSYDYQTLYSLIRKEQLTAQDGAVIVKDITKETLQSVLLLSEFKYTFMADVRKFPIVWSSNFLSLSKECNDEIEAWRSLGDNFYSSYQRPYVIKAAQEETPEKYEYLKKFLVGVDFHQLGLQLQRPAIQVAKSLQPLMASGVVGLRPPKSYYFSLPRLSSNATGKEILSTELKTAQYRIVCVDDSPTILQRMNDFLDRSYFEIFLVQDSAAALTKIITIKPHAVLLDIDMPNIDGYKLCTMIRRNHQMKDMPIMMVTSNSGMVDRVRAKMSGATDFLTKPFTQAKLNDMVFKHVLH